MTSNCYGENLHGRVCLWGCIFFSLIAWWGAKAATIVQDEFYISSDTNVTVAAGDTLHIEYLYGSSTQSQLTKLGAGRLEIAIFGSEKVHVAVSNGTFAVVRPQRMSFADDEQVTYHADATMADSMTFAELSGTNFVAEWRDADGKAHLKAVPHSTRPKPFVSADGINGLPVVDFGTLQNAGGSGYGASLVWEWAAESVGRTNICEYYFAWMDDPGAKNHTGSYRGPCIFGVANASSTVLSGVLTRDLCGNGLTASIHPQSLMGRLQGNNYLDGSIQPGNPQRFYRVPDGPHVFYQWTSEERYPVSCALGFGFNTASGSYGGFKLGEFIISERYFTAARRLRVQRYMLARWLGTTVNIVTLAPGATFDTSACRVKVNNFDACIGTVTDWDNVVMPDFVDAGSGCRPVSGNTAALADRSAGATWNLAFSGAAGLSAEVGTTGAISRVEGVGTLAKTGAGTVLVGTLEGALNKVDVQSGTLRIAPLEAPGVYLRLDASCADRLQTEALNGTNFVLRWNDANGRNAAAATNGVTTYSFDSTRMVGHAYVTDEGPRGGKAVDFGAYTTDDHPEGNGARLALTAPLSSGSLGAPGLVNIMAVWKDRDETSALSSAPYPTIGPSLIGNNYYWFRGLGGDGKGYPMHYYDAPTRMSGSLFIDGEARDWKKYMVPAGWHLLDQQLNWPAGAELVNIGGNVNSRVTNKTVAFNSTDAGGYSPTAKAGVYGGVCFSEIVVFRRRLTAPFRKAVAGALGAKWFGNDNVVGFDSVTLADGTALEMPYTQVCVTNLSFAGVVRMEGVLTLPVGAAVNVSRNAANGFATLSADGLVALGGGTVNLAVADPYGLSGRSFKLFDVPSVSGDFSKESWSVSGLEEFSITARLGVRDDGVWLDVANGGTCVIFR